MKRAILLANFICLLWTCPPALSQDADAGPMGLSVSLARDDSWFLYKETMSGVLQDKDSGPLYGGFLEARYDNPVLFTRGIIDVSSWKADRYDGKLQDGTPISITMQEEFDLAEADLGYKYRNSKSATLAAYAGMGYRYWKRGQNRGVAYREEYSWAYGAAGILFDTKVEKWKFGLDCAVNLPISPQMKTDIAGQVDNATFRLKSRTGFRVETPVSYDADAVHGITLFVFGTPYYQRWNLGASGLVMLKQGGVPVDLALEPNSTTDIYGLRLGVGIRF